jgi:hypothetical protein
MDKLRPEDAAVNAFLAPLIEAISKHWAERDARALHRLREVSSEPNEPVEQGNGSLRELLRIPVEQGLSTARGKTLARVLEGQDPGRGMDRGKLNSGGQPGVLR